MHFKAERDSRDALGPTVRTSIEVEVCYQAFRKAIRGHLLGVDSMTVPTHSRRVIWRRYFGRR